MSSPPYHLRPNKAADRFAFLEAIRRLTMLGDGGLENYTYCSMGGPYLEDFRLLYEFFPEMRMVSIEKYSEVYKRQEFNLPSRTLTLIEGDMSSYIRSYDHGDNKSVFWLDYTKLDYGYFRDFTALLEAVASDSMIKITLRADHRDFWHLNPLCLKKEKAGQFKKDFELVMPDPFANPPSRPGKFACLVQDMLQIATEQVFPPYASSRSFVPIASFHYSDGSWMFTLTGIVCDDDRVANVKQTFENWEFANLEWSPPIKIALPVLSTKERLHLQSVLPTTDNPGSELHRRLGYLIEGDLKRTMDALTQYAVFHRYSPYFVRGIP